MNTSKGNRPGKGVEKPMTPEELSSGVNPLLTQDFLQNQGDPRDNDIRTHRHNGRGSERINIMDLVGMIETVTTAPTGTPQTLWGQVKLHYNSVGPVRRLYVYMIDSAGVGAWRYVALT